MHPSLGLFLPLRLQDAAHLGPTRHLCRAIAVLLQACGLKTFVKNHLVHVRNNTLSQFPASDFFV